VRHDLHFSAPLPIPDWRIARTPDRIERQAGAALAALAHDLEPALTAVETLRDGRRRLGRTAKGRDQGTAEMAGPIAGSTRS
jgi:hypothetical protein